MKTDVQIAQESKLININLIAEKLNLKNDDIEMYGRFKAKINFKSMDKPAKTKRKLVLVTSINPTPAGEGKTTVNIGLSMALNKLGESSISTLREPSMGPVFGIKGGATGGGYSQILPMDDINLHFNGDFHAITSANNLIVSILDNHIYQGNELNINPREVTIKRVLDINDRELRNIVIGLNNKTNGIVREDGFTITVACELMAILCFSEDIEDLKEKASNILVAYTYDKKPIFVKDLNVQGAVALILKDAIKPNLVQTIEHTPAIIHGGPFANIAHGCNSIIATKTSMDLVDYTITEAGFGADLGAEKFFNIKCRKANIKPDVAVIVATIKALKYNGGVLKENLSKENIDALKQGFGNLKRHINNIKKFNTKTIVALNKFHTDTDEEIKVLAELIEDCNSEMIITTVWENGGEGGIELAKRVIELCESKDNNFKYLYKIDDTIENKINSISKEIYGAKEVIFSKKAKNNILKIKKLGYNDLPICVAKNQYSFSDDPKLLGAPTDFSINIKDCTLSAGAEFIVVYTGDILTMPGLPKEPIACKIDISKDGHISGLM